MLKFFQTRIKKIRNFAYRLINIFLVPNLLRFYTKKMRKVSEETQLFLMTRMDLGTFILLLHYIRLWEKKRGKTCLVILTARFAQAKELAKFVCPKTHLVVPKSRLLSFILALFGDFHVNARTFHRVYGQIATFFPHALFLYDITRRSNYVSFFDPYLPLWRENVAKDFLTSYLKGRNVFNFRYELFEDYFKVLKSTEDSLKIDEDKLKNLKKNLNIESPYVVMNINTKNYGNEVATSRKIFHYERYNCVIDSLIEKEYQVVIQGRKEQPLFKERKGLIDYSRSGSCSVENDLILFSGASFSILPKTGPEVFSLILDIPCLGLNYTELATIIPNVRSRFYPKHIKDQKTGRYFHWKEILHSPLFFHLGEYSYADQIIYEEMEEEEMIEALEEFLELMPKPKEHWLEYTEAQRAFKKELNPLHLDLYRVDCVPCNSYLLRKGIN